MEADEGLIAAVEAALADAGIGPDGVDAIVPTGLGVPRLDAAEHGALERVFGKRLGGIPLILTAPGVGNCMAGHGALAAAAGALCLAHGSVPPSGISNGATSATARSPENPIEHVLVCTSALGGQNGAVVLRRWAGD